MKPDVPVLMQEACILKKIAVCSIAIALLASGLKPASALAVIGSPPPPPPAATIGVAGGVAIGVIASAALLCIYDVWLKFNGYKNWDGSPKVVHVVHHRHH